MSLFKSTAMQQVTFQAMKLGLQVWAFQEQSISQIFVTDGTNIGSISVHWGGLRRSTSHKPSRDNGTGLIIDSTEKEFLTDEEILQCMSGESYNGRANKYSSWKEYLQINTILNYWCLSERFKYYLNEIEKIKGNTNFQLRSENGQTKWLDLNEDSYMVLLYKLEKMFSDEK